MAARYRTIVADPPWPYPEGFISNPGRPGPTERAAGADTALATFAAKPLPYPSLTVDAIASLPVRELSIPDTRPAREGSVLFLWTTTKYLTDAHAVAAAWGFAPSAVLVWCKPFGGLAGGTFHSNLEFIIYGRRGAPTVRTAVNTRWFTWPRTRHSEKPAAFYDMVEQVSPGPYLELFARRQRLGWDTWGDEALEHVSLGGEAA